MSSEATFLPTDLPDWMRHARQGLDWGVVLMFAFSLTIAMPFFTQATLPHTNASENYVYRAADYAAAFQEGRLYPRWSANAFGGYGAPIPHYFPPGAGYVSAVLQVLVTNDAVLAVRMLYIISLGLAGSLTYLFVARRTNAATGLLAGMLYVYSPYVGLTAPQLLGDLPGVMTLALIPMLLWSVDRLINRNLPLDVALVALTTAGLYLTSWRAAIISAMIAFFYVLWQRRLIKRKVRWSSVIGSYIVGVGIASFYWIPALLEQSIIHWRAAAVSPNFIITLQTLFSPVHQVDTGLMIHLPQFTLGLTLGGFVLASAATIIYFKRRMSFQLFFLGAGIFLAFVAVVIFPKETWLLGAITLCFAIAGTSVIEWRLRLPRRWQRLFLPSLLILVWITASPVWLPPITTEPFGSDDANAQVQYEQQGYGVAVLPPDLPIPSTIPDSLPPNRLLLDGYQSNLINKIPTSQLTTNFQAGLLDHNTHGDYFQVQVNSATSLNVLTAYFPGWQATLSDRIIPVTANPNTGLINLNIPSQGRGELSIVLDSTPERSAAWIISGDALLVLLVITWGRYRRFHNSFDDFELVTHKEGRLLSIVLLSFAVIIYLFNYPAFPLSLRQRPGFEMQNSIFIQNRTDAGLGLIAFRLENNQYHRGEAVDLTLYWQAQRTLTDNYQVAIRLVNNRDGSVWSETPLDYPGNYPTRRWKTGLYVPHSYRLQLPPDMTAGNYQISLNAQTCTPDCTSGSDATFFGNDGQELGTHLILPTLITVSE
jgi:hypothetical protein